MALFNLLQKLFFKDLDIFIPLVGCLLYLFEMHVQGFGITLDFFDTFDYLLFKNLLPFLHFMNFTIKRLVFRG